MFSRLERIKPQLITIKSPEMYFKKFSIIIVLLYYNFRTYFYDRILVQQNAVFDPKFIIEYAARQLDTLDFLR